MLAYFFALALCMRACVRARASVCLCVRVCCLVFVWFLKASPKLAPALAGPQADGRGVAGLCTGASETRCTCFLAL